MHTQNSTPLLVPGTEEHSKLITASKIGVIMGHSKWQTPAELWLRMRGLADPVEQNEAMLRGKIQEQSILDWFFQVLRPDLEQVSGEVTLTRPDLPWAAATPDAIARDKDGRLYVVDAKSVSSKTADEWGKPHLEEVPADYRDQSMWQMHMTHDFDGLQITGGFLVKHGPFVDKYDLYPIKYLPGEAEWMEQEADKFRQLEECPEPTGGKYEPKTFRSVYPNIERDEAVQLDPVTAAQFITAKKHLEKCAEEERRWKADIAQQMGFARIGMVGSLQVTRRQAVKNGHPSVRLISKKTTVHDIHEASQYVDFKKKEETENV